MKIAILWFWLEGRSTFTFLTTKLWVSPWDITILDENLSLEIPKGILSILGEKCYDSLINFDLIRKSPWITNHIIKTKLSTLSDFDLFCNALTSQTQYFFDYYTGIKIWITGTKGKSTVCTVTHMMMQEAWFDVALVGNVWKPVLDEINFSKPPAYVVYEMSSFMIESLDEFSLDIWLFNNIYSTHTTEHNWFKNYVQAKTRVLSNSKQSLIWDQGFSELMKLWYAWLLDSCIVYWSEWMYTFSDNTFYRNLEELWNDAWMLLLGHHNRMNVCWVFGIADLLDIDPKHLFSVLKQFWWLEHRVEMVWEFGWITWVNDSIATTPQATAAALDTFTDTIDTLFYGWIEWEYSHSIIIERIKKYQIRNIILFPDTGHHIKQWLDESYTLFETRSMQEAVAFAKKHTKKWGIALLSCWSPSFSCWSSLKEKWWQFKQFIKIKKDISN